MTLTTRKMIEAGIIPKNTLQQLVNWRLVPEDYVRSHGTRPVNLDTSDEREVTAFVQDLGEAITKDMAEIRETQFDQTGGYQHLLLEYEQSAFNGEDQVLVDRMGRLFVPNMQPWPQLERVAFKSSPDVWRRVVKKEPRYEGEKVVALVIYLESEENQC